MDTINEGNNRENDYHQQQCVKLQLYSIYGAYGAYGAIGDSDDDGTRCEQMKRILESWIRFNEQNRMDNDKERNYY